MNHLVSTFADATENIVIRSREDLGNTYIQVSPGNPSDLHTVLAVKGSASERARFLHDLIRTAEAELTQLEQRMVVPA